MLLSCISDNHYEAGIDEAGRGCLAGAVFAAAVILPKKFFHKNLNDSKQVKPDLRYIVAEYIKQHAIAYSIAHMDNELIDNMNILQATYQAMHAAIGALKYKPQYLAIDGNRFKPYPNIPYKCCIQGDSKYSHIAAASILAKTARDTYMEQLHQEYPQYDWANNKGYGTQKHYDAIRKFGITRYHRKSFLKKLYNQQLFI